MKSIKLLHAADLHLDSPFDSLPPDQAAERRKEQRKLLFRLQQAAEDNGVSAVLLCGDVFESNSVEKETERAINSALGALPCPVLFVPGNHDPYSADSVWETMRLPDNSYVYKNAAIECAVFPGIPARFWGAGFQDTFSGPLLRGFTAPEKGDEMPDILLIHGDTGPGASDYNPISRDDIIKSGMDYIALGHIHARTSLMRAGETAYAYPGCTEGRGYDETGEKGALLVTLSDDGVEAKFVPLGGARYEIIRVNAGVNDLTEAVLEATEGLTDRDYCRIVLSGECSAPQDAAALRKNLEKKFRELQIRDETVLVRDVWEQRGQDTLTGVFLDRLNIMYKAAKTDKEREKIELAAKYGLSAIENGGGLV